MIRWGMMISSFWTSSSPSTILAMSFSDLTPLLPGAALLENAFTGVGTEPQYAGAAATPGQVGIVAIVDAVGTNVGYTITGWGKDVNILTLSSGQ